MKNNLLWKPDAETVDSSYLKEFMNLYGRRSDDYNSFWRWSVDSSEEFWSKFWDFSGVIGDKGYAVIKDPDKMYGGQFFPSGTLNYAENMLRKRDDDLAIISLNEKGEEKELTFKELYEQVSLLSQALIDAGIQKNDCVCAYMPNIADTIIACLATASIGAIWSSASPDFGVQGVIDRFEQVKPKIIITADAYYYGGKEIDCLEKISEVKNSIDSIEKVIVVPFVERNPDISVINNSILLNDFTCNFEPSDIKFEVLDFNHPLFIMFSSGTTGVPKCIVHGHGGTLLQHLKEHKLQCNIKPKDRVFYFTTCGWMMWNWLITGLASEATLLLYDGSPFYPNKSILWEYTSKHNAMLFGTSAKYIEALKKFKISPKDNFNLDSLKVITSTGSPLVHESFDYVYEEIKEDVHLASISGGTDIVSCFVLGNPISPVYRGEIQGAGLGMAIDVYDDNGNPVGLSVKGEMVCTKPFPSMPVSFWNDPDGSKFHDAYFNKFDNIWCHGDYIERTDNNGIIIHGRSDATLNPGGVRIGTAEIYRQVEKIPEVLESIAVGQEWKDDTRIILFVVMKDEIPLSDNITSSIKDQIKTGASPRHVPALIYQVADIPRTKSGKITELAVRDVLHGKEIKNKEALVNPEALDLYKKYST